MESERPGSRCEQEWPRSGFSCKYFNKYSKGEVPLSSVGAPRGLSVEEELISRRKLLVFAGLLDCL